MDRNVEMAFLDSLRLFHSFFHHHFTSLIYYIHTTARSTHTHTHTQHIAPHVFPTTPTSHKTPQFQLPFTIPRYHHSSIDRPWCFAYRLSEICTHIYIYSYIYSRRVKPKIFGKPSKQRLRRASATKTCTLRDDAPLDHSVYSSSCTESGALLCVKRNPLRVLGVTSAIASEK